MILVLAINVACAGIMAIFDVSYIINFEVAFIGTAGVVYSSYRSVLKKIRAQMPLQDSDVSQDSAQKSEDSSADSALSKKDKFFIGFGISFGLCRILSYAFIVVGIIALINNALFAIIPFVFGVFVASLAVATMMLRNARRLP